MSTEVEKGPWSNYSTEYLEKVLQEQRDSVDTNPESRFTARREQRIVEIEVELESRKVAS